MKFIKKIAMFLIAISSGMAFAACTDKGKLTPKTDNNTVLVEVKKGQEVKTIEEPKKDGFEFKGWYKTRRGRHWLEPKPVQFPYTAKENEKLYAYFEPKDSKTHVWGPERTYKAAFAQLDNDPILNPFSYVWSHEDALMNLLRTQLFEKDINWDEAIKQKLVSKKGDLSNITKKNIGSLEQELTLGAAQEFPEILEGESQGDSPVVNGHYDDILAGKLSGTKFRFKIRKDLKWEDGTPITAEDYLFALSQYIDPKLNYFRSSNWVTSVDRKSGSGILNIRKYFLQGTKLGYVLDDKKLVEDTTGRTKPDWAKYTVLVRGVVKGEKKVIRDFYLTEAELKGLLGNEYKVGETVNLFDNPAITDEKLQTYLHPKWNQEIVKKYEMTVTAANNIFYVGEKGTIAPDVPFSAVGFKKVDDYTFDVEFERPKQYSSVVSILNNLHLVHKETYLKSKTQTGEYQYGTAKFQPLSYGAYVIKSWDEQAKMVFNKNFASEQSLKHNHKAISYEFVKNWDTKMELYKQGKFDTTGLTPDYYAQYAEDPTLRQSHTGYPQNMLLNPQDFAGKAAGAADILKDLNFRKALFFGIDRKGYNEGPNAPSIPSVFGMVDNATQYNNDPEFYTQTTEYAEMLKSLGITRDGFDKTKAKEFFDKAYTAWLAKGHSGKIQLKVIHLDSETSTKSNKYIFDEYKKLFGEDKIDFELVQLQPNAFQQKLKAKEFDLCISNVGYGSGENVSVMITLKYFFTRSVYGSNQYGSSDIEDFGYTKEQVDELFNIKEEEKLDLRKTYEFLKSKSTLSVQDGGFDDNTDSGTLKKFYDVLNKNNGYFIGDARIIHEFGLECNYIWAGSKPQYDGDVADRNTVTRYFNKKGLETMPIVPLASGSSASVYSKNFYSQWPAYHNIMQWGFARYNFLLPDPDFAFLKK